MMSGWWSDLLRVATFLVAAGVFLIIVWKRHAWSGPSQEARLNEMESEFRIVRGNVARIERDQSHFHREYMDCNQNILRELENLKANGGKHEICAELKVIEDRITDMETVIASMPCQPQCKPKEA